MTATDLALNLTKFLTEYLPGQRNVSPNTILGYRDAFVLLLRYCRDVRGVAIERLCIEQIDADLVLACLRHLEAERHWKPSTRNNRLAAVHSFFRYLQTEHPERLFQCQRILAIPLQKCPRPIVHYLSADDLEAIFAQPDLTTPMGRRDAVLLSVLYDTGARVQELIDLSPRDVRLEMPAQVQLTGKGRKSRIVPLMDSAVAILREYIEEHGLKEPGRIDGPLFRNRKGGRLSRSGIRYILEKYVRSARSIRPSLDTRISPHWLRHSKAMHLLQTGNPLVVIRNILGHANVKTTEIYARADLGMKRRALERAADASPKLAISSWHNDKDLMTWLRSL